MFYNNKNKRHLYFITYKARLNVDIEIRTMYLHTYDKSTDFIIFKSEKKQQSFLCSYYPRVPLLTPSNLLYLRYKVPPTPLTKIVDLPLKTVVIVVSLILCSSFVLFLGFKISYPLTSQTVRYRQ